MSKIKLSHYKDLPIEMHKVRTVQKLTLLPIDERVKAIEGAGFNSFLLRNKDVFLDMLTDSGTNAMSDLQIAAMMRPDDAYSGSETFYRLEKSVQDFFGTKFFLPTHQGRACENIIAQVYVKPGQITPMNYHFTTTKAHISARGGIVDEIYSEEAININSECNFKGDIDMGKLKALVAKEGVEKISFVRIELGTNLIGGQPISLKNMKEIKKFCVEKGLMVVMDVSLLADNLYFIKTKEKEYQNMEIGAIVREIAKCGDILYFSARKLGCARGGGIAMFEEKYFMHMRDLVPFYEGFITYGGMSTREMEAIAVGLEETLDFEMINQGPEFIAAFGKELQSFGVPIVTPVGGLGCHIDARAFLDHVPSGEYPAASLIAAIYITCGCRGMERGTVSEDRNPDGTDHIASVELVRLALPRRVFTLSQIKFAADRIGWLYKNRKLIGGLEFTEEPKVLRFFVGRLAPKTPWTEKLVKKFKEDFGDSL